MIKKKEEKQKENYIIIVEGKNQSIKQKQLIKLFSIMELLTLNFVLINLLNIKNVDGYCLKKSVLIISILLLLKKKISKPLLI